VAKKVVKKTGKKKKGKKRDYRKRALHQFVFKIFLVVAFLGFFGVALYPFVVDSLNDVLDQEILQQYQKRANSAYQAKQEEKYKEQARKERLRTRELADPFSQASLDNALVKNHSSKYFTDHTIGIVYIPTIHQSLPIFDSSKEDFLSRGAAWLASSDYPKGGASTHTVISGHRGLPTAALFTDLDKVKKDEIFILLLGKDNYLAYKVYDISVIEPGDLSKIGKEDGRDLATLLTCTPYMVNTHRLLVTGERTPFTPSMLKDIERARQRQLLQRYALLAAIILSILFAIYYLIHAFLRMRIKRRRYDVVVKVYDSLKDLPYDKEIVLGLFDKKGKHPIKRRGVQVTTSFDPETKELSIQQLPGMYYRLKPMNHEEVPSFLIYVKRRKHKYFRLKAKGRKYKKYICLKITKDQVHLHIKRAEEREKKGSKPVKSKEVKVCS